MRRFIILPLVATAALLGLTACTAAPTNDSVTVSPDTIIIDVRNDHEYAAGHLEGAQHLDFNGGEFTAALPTLNPNAEYLVYCRSGNRAGQAITLMEDAGFTNITNLGSVDQAAHATGISIIK